MSTRLYQHRFELQGSQMEFTVPTDVTPDKVSEFSRFGREREIKPRLTFQPASDLGRFIREVVNPYTVTDPGTAARYLQDNVFTPFEQCQQEELWALCLNTKNRITHDSMIYRGNVNSSIIRMAEVFRPAIQVNSTAVILSHCHPSGDPTPSPEDVRVTNTAVAAGQLLGIEVLDHLIIGQGFWVSLKERGLGFEGNHCPVCLKER